MDHDGTWGSWRSNAAGEETGQEFEAYNKAAVPWVAVLLIMLACWKFRLLPEIGVIALLLVVPAYVSWAYWPGLLRFALLRKTADGLLLAALSIGVLAVIVIASDSIERLLPSGEDLSMQGLFVDKWLHATLAVLIVAGLYRYLRPTPL
jgi:hypothetical protein